MAAETDIYQWVMQAYRSLLQRFVADAYVQEHGLGMPLHDLDDVPPGRWTTDSDVCIGGRSMDAPRESDPIALAREYRIGKVGSIDFFVDWLRDTTSGFERLEQILDRYGMFFPPFRLFSVHSCSREWNEDGALDARFDVSCRYDKHS